MSTDFQRARRPEQREVRRNAILDAAQELLAEHPAQDISLREIARHLGGSKSGIVGYYETREALFLELLRRALRDWLDELGEELPDTSTDDRVTEIWARSLARRPVLCELWSVLSSVLERNVSVEAVRDFKLDHHAHLRRLAAMIAERLPGLPESAPLELVNTSVVLVAGLWPFANPTRAVREAIDDPRLASAHIDFAATFARGLRVHVAGLRQLANCG
ncbi:MAG TPA: TetR family transcriptional regulator [Pseudonocardiaceae bacterium]